MKLTRIKTDCPKDEFDLRLTRAELFALRGIAGWSEHVVKVVMDAQRRLYTSTDGPTDSQVYRDTLSKIWELTNEEIQW